MVIGLLICLIFLTIVNILIVLFRKPKFDIRSEIQDLENIMHQFETLLEKNEKLIKDEFQRNRDETNKISKENREELSNSLDSFEKKSNENTKEFNELLRQKFGDFSTQQTEINKQTLENIKAVNDSIEKQLKEIREDNTKQLDEMRKTVDEKLQKTLNDRLSQSFETVNKQLKAVQEGLGEMKNLATDVGGLKKVLSNVKMRGGIGELQLEMLLEQILAPDQYSKNVATKKGSQANVEFAVKLPGKDDSTSIVWLPIDAKFPKDKYQVLIDSYEKGDVEKIATAQKDMEATIKKMAKEIRDRYIDPPNTTDFGIMYLPFEGIFAEVVRNSPLLELLMREYNIIVTGPTTLAAILNSLQMGFKTLAIQKSSEVWQVLGAVKKEFGNFSGMMEKAQKNIQTGLNQLDDVMGKRTRAIQRKLKNIESLDDIQTRKILPEIAEIDTSIEEDDIE